MTFKDMWNTVVHSQEVWPEPQSFGEYCLHNMDMVFYHVLAVAVMFAYLGYEEWKFLREERRMKEEAELYARPSA